MLPVDGNTGQLAARFGKEAPGELQFNKGEKIVSLYGGKSKSSMAAIYRFIKCLSEERKQADSQKNGVYSGKYQLTLLKELTEL